ncbi:hypothetical protein SCP_0203740 [Sparassis crispa]|uniref:Uncharacterized protein n=1 Tax=Sparassis crispa TaxID=139825 RepID=A0A401GAK4_9APHY|nr:hypothetical protein SCP_0203740 [Sparassis crispa]GBE79177.1 hypothetical protein SCP_0203740 [Sparassis crispa]
MSTFQREHGDDADLVLTFILGTILMVETALSYEDILSARSNLRASLKTLRRAAGFMKHIKQGDCATLEAIQPGILGNIEREIDSNVEVLHGQLTSASNAETYDLRESLKILLSNAQGRVDDIYNRLLFTKDQNQASTFPRHTQAPQGIPEIPSSFQVPSGSRAHSRVTQASQVYSGFRAHSNVPTGAPAPQSFRPGAARMV